MKQLILITSSFPICRDEPFLEMEYAYLAEKFDKIDFVVVTNSAPQEPQSSRFGAHDVVEMKVNVTNKFKVMVSGLFTKLFWSELKYILPTIKFPYFLSSLKVAIVCIENARLIRSVLEDRISASDSSENIIYSYWGDAGVIAAAQMAGHPKVHKVVTRVHGWDLYFDVHSPPYLPFRSLIQKKCSFICPISEKGRWTIKDVWNVPDTNVVTSRLGVERQKVPLNRSDGVFTLVSCSNVIPLKRVQLIAESVLAIDKPIKWIHFGGGEEFETITTFVDQTKKPHHEIILFGNVENSVILDFYKNERVDLFINASTTEGIPFSIMEAISFGIPILATNVGGNNEIVSDENGTLLPENPTSEEIGIELKRFMDMDDTSYQKFVAASYNKWESDFNAEKNFTAFVDLISA